MKLTSKNIALKALKAKGCLSDTVKRMWEYIEEGDIERSDCARMKALKLASWIDALERWRPTISNGYRTVVLITGVLPDPSEWILSNPSINGIYYTNILKVYASGIDFSFISAKATNCAILPNDDILIVNSTVLDGDSGKLTFLSINPVNYTPFLSATSTIIEDNVPFTGMQPYCLTNEEVLSIVGKIDELCDCNC